MGERTSGRAVKWSTPFGDVTFPAVAPIFDPESVKLTVVVMPGGLRKYPGYTVVFADVAFFSVTDETNASTWDHDWVAAGGNALSPSSSYIWEESPLLVRNRHLGVKAVFESATLKHYILAGGDYIVDVLAPGEPTISRFDEPYTVVTKQEF
jgi:hypothetical protein